MTKKIGIVGKVLIIMICLLFLISIGLNISQYKTLNSERDDNIYWSRNFISNQEVTFSNVFSVAGNTNILEYIKKPDHLSNIIEGIQLAGAYYQAATKLVSNEISGKSILWSQNLIVNGYLSELRSYRTYLQNNSNAPYENINQVAIDISDLQTISSWLMEKHKNNDFEVYTDEDFYNEVYDKLKSDIKSYYRH